MKPIDFATLEREITTLVAAYPELAADDELRADMLAGSTETFEILNAIVSRMQDSKTMAAAVKERAKDMAERAARYQRREQAMRELAERVMRVADLRKVELPEATLSIRATPPAIVITDERELPDEYWRVTRAPDKAAIKDALKAGEFVPGVELSNGSESLSVRTA